MGENKCDNESEAEYIVRASNGGGRWTNAASADRRDAKMFATRSKSETNRPTIVANSLYPDKTGFAEARAKNTAKHSHEDQICVDGVRMAIIHRGTNFYTVEPNSIKFQGQKIFFK